MKHLAKWLTGLAIAVSFSKAHACGSWLGPEGYRIGLFLPYTYYKPWMGMLQYDLDNAYDPSIILATAHDRDLNCMEWKNYCGTAVKKEDIYFVMYEMPAGYFLEIIDGELKGDRTESGNTFIKWLRKKENAPVLLYMKFAKSSENISMQRIDPWDEDIPVVTDEYYDPGYKAMLACKDPFLLQRWLFQFARRHAYGPAIESQISTVSEKIERNAGSSSLVNGWTNAYMAYMEEGDPSKKNILLARAFDLTADKKYFAKRYFSSPHLAQTISDLYSDSDAHLRAVVYGLAALNRQEECMDLVRKIIHEDANSEIFELVITREIQKIEDQLMTEKMTGYFPASNDFWANVYYEKELIKPYDGLKKRILLEVSTNNINRIYFKSYAQMLLKVLEELLHNGRLSHSSFFHLAAAHLCWCLEKGPEMKAHLDHAGPYVNEKNEWYTTYCTEKILLHTLGQKGLDEQAASQAYDLLKYMDGHQGHDVENLRDQLCMVLVSHYENSGELHKATLMMSHIKGLYRALPVISNGQGDYTRSCSRYFAQKASLKDADALLAFYDAPRHNKMDKYLLSGFAHDSARYDMLMEWVGSVYVRNEKWEKALHTFARIDKRYWNMKFNDNEYEKRYKGEYVYEWTYYPRYLDINPFEARIASNHRPQPADSVRYNKFTFVKKWLSLQKESKSANVRIRDKAFLQMAHARYNMTWYGNAWIMWRNEWSNYESKYWPGFEKDYYACERARAAYSQLYSLTKDKNIKARCCIMLAVCDRNKAYYDHRSYNEFEYSGSFYLDEFMKKYEDTKTYTTLMSSCLGEEEFLSSIKRDEGY